MGEESFPVGLRVLVVDDNRTSLKIIEKMMTKCKYQVTTTTRARDALSMLKQKNNIFDLVVSEVHMPDMDGFKLLEQIKLETDIPVMVMSFEYDKSDVLKSINHGACDYLIKPIPLEMVKTMWQHVVRKQMNEMKELERSGMSKEKHRAPFPTVASLCSVNEASWRSSNKNKDDDEVELEEKDDSSPGKRRRVVWSAELHQKFVSVVEQLGVQKAVPKKILQLMDMPGITRENVASHLQKYRLYLRRGNGGSTSQNQVGRYAKPLSSSQRGNAQRTSAADALAIQEMTLLDQLLLPNIPPRQSLGVVSSNNGPLPLSQNDPFKSSTSFNSKIGYGRHNINSLNTSNFHGLPSNATIDPMQLAYLQHQQVQNARKMSPQPYILSSNGSAIFSSNVGALYNNLVPIQFQQPSPVYDHAMATQLAQLPLTANGLLLNATTLLPGVLQDEGCSDAEALQSPTPSNVSKSGV